MEIKGFRAFLQFRKTTLHLYRDAEDTFNRLVKQMAEREGVTEKLKADNQMEWVGRMNNIRQRATEIVNTEMIYA